MEKILVIDDNEYFLEGFADILDDYYKITSCSNSTSCLDYIGTDMYNAIVVDIHMPIWDGYSVIERIKSQPKYNGCPIILMSSDLNVAKKIKGLEIEVDDIIDKAMSPEEIIIRIKNKVEHFNENNSRSSLDIGNMTIHRSLYQVFIDGEEIPLTHNEMKILLCLVDENGSLIPREEVVKKVWPDKVVGDGTLNTHLSNLRKKIKNFSGKINCVRDAGVCILVD